MYALSNLERAECYLVQAQAARRMAQAPGERPYREHWLRLAENWEFLAQLQFDPCFCGEPSIGYKYFAIDERLAVCDTHMTELVVHNALSKIGLRKLQ